MDRDYQRLRSIFDSALKLYLRKNRDYGSSFKKYGLKGIVNSIGVKSSRLDNLVWFGEEVEVKGEPVSDTLIDLIVEAGLGIMCLEKNNLNGKVHRIE